MEEVCEHAACCPMVPGGHGHRMGDHCFREHWVANRMGGRGAAVVVGLLLVIATVFNVSKLPHALWFKVVIVPVMAAAAGLAIE